MGFFRRKRTDDAEPQAASADNGKERPYTGRPIADLQQADLIEELARAGMSRDVAGMRVQVALVLASTMDRAQIEAIHHGKLSLTVEDVALKWAVHCIYHGARPRTL